MFEIFFTETANKKLNKILNKVQLEEIKIFCVKHLRFHPHKVGDPLSYSFLREKKISGKRLYYLVYVDLNIVLIVDISNKKQQKETIHKIKNLLSEYKVYVKKLLE